MRLIGGKDYYDGVTGFDTDERRVFVRKNFNKAEPRPKDKGYLAEYSGLDWYSYIPARDGLSRKDADLKDLFVIFCGKLYKGVVRRESHYDSDTGNWNFSYQAFWNPNTVQAELNRQGAILDSAKNVSWGRPKVSSETLAKYFEPIELKPADLKTLVDENIVHSIGFRAFGDRYAAVSWYDNTDGLKQFGFASAVDPWQAYQQIDMWVGSQLAKEEDNMVRLSDKELIAKHGFDKVSFRNTHHVGKPRGQK